MSQIVNKTCEGSTYNKEQRLNKRNIYIYIHKEDEFQTIKRNFQNIQKISFNQIFRVRIYQEKTENNEAQLQFSKIPTSQAEFNP